MKKGLLLYVISALLFLMMPSAKVMAANATLNNLVPNVGTLSPSFDPNTFSYNIIVSDVTSNIKFTPTQTLNGSTIKINGSTVSSGSQSSNIALSPGDNIITIKVTKSGNTSETYTITVTQEDINYTGTPYTVYAGSPISTLSATPTGDTPTSFSASSLPAGLSINPTTGDITGTPTATSGATNYTVTASYGGGITATATVNIKVSAPTISYAGSPVTIYTGSAMLALSPTTVGGTPTSYSAASLPPGLSIDPTTGAITGAPTTTSAATNYTVTATYSGGITATTTVNIKVLAPSISYTGSPFSYFTGLTVTTLTPTTVGGAPTSYSGTLPAGLTLNTSTGTISGTPTAASAATNYTITATYGAGVTATATINIKVTASTIAYAGSPFTYTAGTAITTANSTEVGGNPVSYSGTLPAGLTLNASTGSITGTPTTAAAATVYPITATYTGGATATTNITITVNPAKPVISYTGSPFAFTSGTAISPLNPNNTGGTAASWSISPTTLPAGLSFDNTTGIISGTPTAVTAATTFTITATNVTGSGSTTISIKVNPPAPVISYTPSTNIYVLLNAIPTLSPVNTGGAATSWSISPGLPFGLSFNTSTGAITGTPLLVSPMTTYTITATNAGGSGSTTVNIAVNALPPIISYVPAVNVYTVGVAITPISPTNIGGTPTSYSISGTLPAGLSFDTTTGTISGTPTATSPVTAYTVTASNSGGSGNTTITISCVNPLPPNISYTPSTNTYVVGTAIATLTPVNIGGPVTGGYSVSPALPAGLTLNTTTGVITGTPTTVTATATYTVSATNAGGTGTATLTLTVNPQKPVISYSPSANVYTTGVAISPLTPTNTGGAAASYSISATLPAGLSFDTTTGIISGTPTAVITATTFTITATNVTGSGSTTVNLTVNPPPPVISYSPATNIYNVNSAITPLNPTNTGGAAVTWSISPALPSGLTINTSTGVISGTPTTDIAATTFTITATNAGGSGSTTVNLTVYPLPPVVSYSPSTNVFPVGSAASLSPTNTGGAAVTWSIGPSLPAGLSFNTSTGVISGTPTLASPVKTYTISAENPGGISTTTVKISCTNPAAPNISYSPSTNVYTSGTAITSLTPTNSGGAASSYSIDIALPAGLSFDTTTGIISGTPTAVSPATTYTITATNAAGSASTTVNLTVNDSAPNISYSPTTYTYSTGATISAVTPINSGGTPTSYSISAPLPAGLSFNTSTGVISGTPTATSPATNYTITATNTTGTSSATIKISVNNNAPNISYSPGTVSYSVGTAITPATPTNTGGAASTFTISGGTLPTGLTFNTSTGVISGTPSVVFPTTTFTIKATNASGNSSTSLIITVSPHAPIISYTPSTNAYPINAAITPWTPVNTGGATTGYSYSSSGISLTGASLSGPSLMTIDASGNIYVANYNNGTISKYNSSGTYIGKFGTGKTLTNPEGIVFDSAGNAYVEDTGAGAVYKYNSSGVYQSTIITGLNHPLGISIDPSNNLYIATYVYTFPYTSSVTKYSTSGTLISNLNNAQMDQSDGVATDGSGNIYVLNRAQDATGTNKGYVTKYNSAGVYQGIFSSGYEDPLAISVDPSGNVFVADSHNNQVKIYSSTGVLLNTISGFNDVEGFVADANGNLYVSDFTNNTVKEYTALGGYHISAPLPPGLSFNTSNGQITGTPTTVFPPTTYTVTAYNITGSGSTNITISCYQSNDWIGVTSTDWNTASNWLSGVVPGATDPALIGVNQPFTYFPTVLAGAGTVNVGSVTLGNVGGQAPGVQVNVGSTLNVNGAITYQSDASAGLGYTATLQGSGTVTASSISVISNTTLTSSYTSTFSSSVNNLNVTNNIALTSSNSGAKLFNSTFKLIGGTALLSGAIQTTNTSGATSSFIVIPTTAATLQLASSTALSGLSASGTNVVTFRNTGSTIQYSGAAQTVYTSASITGLSAGVSYQNITFSGTGVKTANTGTLFIVGDFANTMANDASNYVNLVNATVNFNGNTESLAGGGGNGTTFYTVNFNGTGTKTMASGQFNIAPSGVLTMVGTCACNTLVANGHLTLKSDATGSGTFAETDGPVISGTVNVERYVTGGAGYRGYRDASSPVYTYQVGGNNVYSINYLQNSMYLSGNAGGGFDKTGNPALYLFREDQTPSATTFISGNFWGINSLLSDPYYSVSGQTAGGTYNIPAGNGFLFFFRGNRASASLATETVTTYVPVSATLTASGTLNQGQVIFKGWYTPSSSYLNYTGTGTGTNASVRGFNFVGNPYASTIDWEQFNVGGTGDGIYGNNVSTTIYEFNPATQNYDTYQQGGVHTNHGRRSIVSGQGFFVLATSNSNPQLIFNESAKLTTQNTGLNLFMAKRRANVATLSANGPDPYLRIQMALDTINADDTYIGFNNADSAKFVFNEDAPYRASTGKVSMASFSSDHVRLAINKIPFPKVQQSAIPLFVTATAYGAYSLNMTEMENIPQIYQVWLMDNFKKDSLDMRHNKTYAFDITTDTGSYGSHRFKLVLRQDPAYAVHLLNFTALKAAGGAQTNWVTENEQNYTSFTLERSTDGGKNYVDKDDVASSGQGTYGFLDTQPINGANLYRLKMVDLNGAITYSSVITVMYGNTNANGNVQSRIAIYPNPAKTTITLTIASGTSQNSATQAPAAQSVYGIKIVNALGTVVKNTTTSDTNWQSNISGLLPGTYVLQVVNNSDNSLVGKGTFIKVE